MHIVHYLVSKMMDATVLIVRGSAGPPEAALKSRPMPCKPGLSHLVRSLRVTPSGCTLSCSGPTSIMHTLHPGHLRHQKLECAAKCCLLTSSEALLLSVASHLSARGRQQGKLPCSSESLDSLAVLMRGRHGAGTSNAHDGPLAVQGLQGRC